MPFEFDGKRKEEPVTIGNQKYILVEATGGPAAEFEDACMSEFQLGPDGKVIGSKGSIKHTFKLLGACLLKDEQPVGEEFARSLANSVSAPLIKWIRENSDLRGDAPKKGQNSSDGGSNSQSNSAAP